MLRLPTPQRSPRRGYTLVELLVVIAIIGVLVGLVMAAVSKVRGKGDEFKVKADIAGLDTAIGQFKGKFGRFPACSGHGAPYNGTSILNGTFRLCTRYATLAPVGSATKWNFDQPGFNANSPEVLYLTSLFPQINLQDNGLMLNGAIVPAATPMLLDPNQCLVFFLSGGKLLDYLGFSTDPTRPFTAGAGQRLQGTPFFDFKQDRMQTPIEWLVKHSPEIQQLPVPPSGFTASNVFRWEGTGPTADTLTTVSNEPWFLDPWKNPYLYMSTSGVGSGGDYPFRDTVANSELVIGPWGGRVSNFNFNPSPPPTYLPQRLGPTAFREPNLNNKWVNHAGFQIVSAGPNGSQIDRNLSPAVDNTAAKSSRLWGFGPGGQAQFGKTAGYTAQDGGGDDFANFRSGPLSATD